MLQLG